MAIAQVALLVVQCHRASLPSYSLITPNAFIQLALAQGARLGTVGAWQTCHELLLYNHNMGLYNHEMCLNGAPMNSMLEAIFGSRSATQVLLFLQNYGEGYARRIAETFDAPPNAIQRQLIRLEAAGILVSRSAGRTRIFTWNPRSGTVGDLRAFLEAELERLGSEKLRRQVSG
ncbi:MAG: helix-turn-helix transcriptional regulator [Gammaproteobacteria bacterium]|nr:helix-turn-helix transcriptional regulator [Gammaproteobacteria bacterium]